MEIHHKKDQNKGYFLAQQDDLEAGRMTYTQAGDDKIIIDHTEVNPSFSGQGVGKRLVIAAVEFAREQQIKILPLCPFAKAVLGKKTELQDVLFN